MALDRRRLNSLKNRSAISFYKLLGTGKGESFTPLDADPHRWGMLVCLPESEISRFDNSALVNNWRKFARSEVRFTLTPISAHGLWSGQEPFHPISLPDWNGPVAAITRAKIVPRENLRFWKSVPPVSKSLHDSEGLLAAIGIGEAPIGLQGTFSLWRDGASLKEFAYKGAAHRQAIANTNTFQWYSEELFARFAVIEQRGDFESPYIRQN
jgi:hypothetical protein